MKARRIIIPAAIVLGAGGLIAGTMALRNLGGFQGVYADSIELEKKDIQLTVSTSGTIESGNAAKVFTSLSYPVETVNVSVGDDVKKGDVLCVLDTDDLQSQILQQQATIDSSGISTDYQLTAAEKNYNEALEAYNNGGNSQMKSAEHALENAEAALRKAEEDYNEAVDRKNGDANTQIQSADLTLKGARDALDRARKDYDAALKEVNSEDYSSAKAAYDTYESRKKTFDEAAAHASDAINPYKSYETAYSKYLYYRNNIDLIPEGSSLETYKSSYEALGKKAGVVAEAYNLTRQWGNLETALLAYCDAKAGVDASNKSKLDSAELALENAEQAYENADIALKSANDSSDDGIDNYKNQLDNARLSYENAKSALDITVKDIESNLASLKAAADKERILSSSNNPQVIALENLKSKLEDAVIKAPCDGTVTYSNATQGDMPMGTLFIIEDISDLIVTASLSEYDISGVSEGMPVIITSTALGEQTFDGIVTKIAPTAEKSPDGALAGQTTSFKIEVAVSSENTPLLVGMSVKLNIITQEKTGVFAIRYDAIFTDDDGNDIIYVAEQDETGVYKAFAVPVTVGTETDFEAEIISDELDEGALILVNSGSLADGATVRINQ